MKQYEVHWFIEVDAETPLQAAAMAKEIQEDPDSTATVFRVKDQATGETVVADRDHEEKWRIL